MASRGDVADGEDAELSTTTRTSVAEAVYRRYLAPEAKVQRAGSTVLAGSIRLPSNTHFPDIHHADASRSHSGRETCSEDS